jgi:hypothetical protein
MLRHVKLVLTVIISPTPCHVGAMVAVVVRSEVVVSGVVAATVAAMVGLYGGQLIFIDA